LIEIDDENYKTLGSIPKVGICYIALRLVMLGKGQSGGRLMRVGKMYTGWSEEGNYSSFFAVGVALLARVE
jgi:hypothetical protein